jgi:hypothetical protein
MPVTLINSHVLIPDSPNWRTEPAWSRAWQTQVAGGVTGAESRTAVRMAPRVSLRWTVMSLTLQDHWQLDDRIRAALKLGLACAPYWGRGIKLALDLTADLCTLTSDLWPWAEDDYIFLLDAFGLWEVRQIIAVAGAVLTLDDDVARTYTAPLLVWPLLYGELKADMSALTSWHADVPLELREYSAPESAVVVGDYTPPDPDEDLAIPEMAVGSTFVVR